MSSKKVLLVKVIPESREEKVEKKGDYLVVHVSAEPEHGQANARLIQLLSAYLLVPPAKLAIISGHKSRTKKVIVNG